MGAYPFSFNGLSANYKSFRQNSQIIVQDVSALDTSTAFQWSSSQRFLNVICLCPKRRRNAQLLHGLYHHANIMTQDITKDFIDNSLIGFVAEQLTLCANLDELESSKVMEFLVSRPFLRLLAPALGWQLPTRAE